MDADESLSVAPGADPRADLQQSVAGQLERVEATRDPASALAPEAYEEARKLAALLRDDDEDLWSRYLLGWLHWYRYLALPEGLDQEDLRTAVAMLTPCFTAGIAPDRLPEPLVPTLADEMVPYALSMFEHALTLADAHSISTVVALWRHLLTGVPADSPERAGWLCNLGVALRVRFQRTGAQADLDEAVHLGREAVDTALAEHPERAKWLTNCAATLMLRFEQTGAEADLDEAVRLGREAVDTTPADHPERAGILSSVGSSLRIRFERTGARADLDEAAHLGRKAVDATPADHPQRAGWLSNLTATLMRRFEHTGTQADLDEAARLGRETVDTAPADAPERAAWLSNFGVVLRTRFMQLGAAADLDEAITQYEEAVAATPAERHARAAYLSNLGNALQDRFVQDGARADLDEAITRFEEAVAVAPAGHADRPRWLTNLGRALQRRFDQSRAQNDLNEAVRINREAVSGTPADHIERATYLFDLGNALQRRFTQDGAETDLSEAIDAYQEAVDLEVAPPSIRVWAARAASALAVGSEPGRAAGLLGQAVRLLPEVAPRQLERADQQYALGGFAGLAADAAALALADPDRPAGERAPLALRLLETGRAVLLGQALESRGDLTELTRQRPDLAAHFIRLRDQLDQPYATFTADPDGDPAALLLDPGRATRNRRHLAEDWVALLAEIHALPGFESFALPPTADELLAQAAEGPVVVFNVSRYRSDALLLTADGITCLPLPGLPIDVVASQVTAFHQALGIAGRHDRTAQDRRAAQQQVSQILRWLWDNAAFPVLDALGHHAAPAPDQVWPRIWWVPGGLLGLLPVHAAGHHTSPPDPAARAVMDRVVSSYTPTIGALRYARRHPPSTDLTASGRAAIVAMPTTPGLPGRLHHVLDEARKVAAHLPESALLVEPDPTLPGPPDDAALSPSASAATSTLPTKDNVLGLLGTCSIAHFACHGVSDATDPSHSRLLVHDHDSAPLTVAALAPVRLDHVQLAYLSACETAVTIHTQLRDEAINLATAFQLAGYPHVIGTLWAINDYRAVQIADAFYAALTSVPVNGRLALDAGRAADALHHAIRTVRQMLPAAPSLWAAHLHAGA
ncbi:CHAT domain-containing protein [Streptomyces sp. NPDC059037]|uniref:CHAT domain-containing tetratricopeptide repeat protein n=1 Tax=Streptomyces sp. NPDC059037 TaxID=3346710 RepID=UPI0036AB65CE